MRKDFLCTKTRCLCYFTAKGEVQSVWFSPRKVRKARVVAIVSDPSTSMLYRKRGEPCITDSRSAYLCLKANPLKNRPVTFARLYNLTMRLTQKVRAKLKSFFAGTWLNENTRIRRNSNNCAQSERRDTEPTITCHCSIKPCFTSVMARGISSKGVNEYINVG